MTSTGEDDARAGRPPVRGVAAVVPLARATTRAAGAKAGTLGRLLRRGFPAPDGFVILPAAAAPLRAGAGGPGVAELRRAVAKELGRLGARRVAVRSSASVEDRPGRSAAGLFHTTLDVPATPAAVLRAAAACVASLRAPHVTAYLRGRAAPARMAVLVQPMARGLARGVLFTRDPDAPGRVRLELEDPAGRVSPASFPRTARAAAAAPPELRELLRLGPAVEALLGCPADIEFVLTAAGPVLVQARPAPPARPHRRGGPRVPAALRALTLYLDAEHNPVPLSPAHQGLIARLDGRVPGAARLAVIDGYLYSSASAPPAAPPVELARLWRRLRHGWERELRAAEDAPPLPVRAALAAFERFADAYAGELQPAIRQVRRELLGSLSAPVAAALAATVRSATTARDDALWRLGRLPAAARGAALRRFLRRHGALAPDWDLAAPTYAEDPRPLLAAARALVAERRSPDARRRGAARPAGLPARVVARSRLLAAVREADDLYFARALWQLRRALLARGARLHGRGALDDPADVFLLPLLPEPGAHAPLRARVAAARARLERQRRRAPPARFVDGVAQWDEPHGGLRGVGCGGRAHGPAWCHRGTGAPPDPPRGAVLICATLLPAWTFVLPHLAAVVTEEGGALSHGAILAREYGVPAVFGVRGALARIHAGDPVVVDGTAGRVWIDRRRR